MSPAPSADSANNLRSNQTAGSTDADSLFRLEPLAARAKQHCAAFDRSPLASLWLVVATVLVVVLGMSAIATLPVARKATVPGRITLQSDGAALYANQRLNIDALYVAEGDTVYAGQTLAALTSAERVGTQQPGALLQSLAAQRDALAQAETNEIELARARSNVLRQRSRTTRQQTRLLETRRLRAAAALELARTRETRAAQLVASGHAPKTQQEEAEYARLEFESNVDAMDQERIVLVAEQRQLDAELATLKVELDRALARMALERQRLHVETTRVKAEREELLVAPIDGLVSGVLGDIGTTVDPSRPVITVLPAVQRYAASLWVPAGAAGAVSEGQAVRLLVDAFPHQRFGSIPGQITHVNRSALPVPGSLTSSPLVGPAYEVAIRMDVPNALVGALKPGMSLRADISLEQRPLYALLFESLLSAFDRTAA